jgi:oligoribonuclease
MSVKYMPEALLWMDIETTGLNPLNDSVLEVEMRITPYDASMVESMIHVVLLRETRDGLSNWAIKTHTDNGLLDECASQDCPAFADIQRVNTFVRDKARLYTLHPAGSSVHFDMSFFSQPLWKIRHYCNHRRLDVTSMRMAFEAAGVALPAPEPTNHRTTMCLDRDIMEYRTMLKTLDGLQAPSDVDGVVRGE